MKVVLVYLSGEKSQRLKQSVDSREHHVVCRLDRRFSNIRNVVLVTVASDLLIFQSNGAADFVH